MKISKEEFIDLLILKAKEYDIEISREKAKKLYLYKELLLDWNEKINLTAITEDEDIIVKHFIDSLLSAKYIEEAASVIDVGTGAGFPGIVLAIYFEEKVDITLLDSLNKRIIFLDDVISKLNLKNVKAVHGRAEEKAHEEEYRECYDIAIARAVAPLNILLEYLSGYIKKGGKCICMKAVSTENEINNAGKAIEILNLKKKLIDKKIIKYKNEDMVRQFVVLEKQEGLNNKYPRSYGKIKKNPL